MTNYQESANKFAQNHNVKMTVLDSTYGKHFSGDTESRCIFKIKLQRGRNSYTFDFGQSIAAGSQEPTLYDILTCLQKSDVGSFQDFCDEFGYDEDSRTAEKTYKAVCKEYAAMSRLFTEEELEKIYEVENGEYTEEVQ